MKFEDNIVMQNYTDEAYKQFNEWQARLVETENNYTTRMEGKTVGKIIGSIIITSVLFYISFLTSNSLMGRGIIYIVACTVTMLLLLILLIDEITSLCYYGKFSRHKKRISMLKTRVQIGKNSIGMSKEEIYNSRQKGYEYELKAGDSIPEKAIDIENTMANMQSLSGNLLPTLKNVLFFSDVVIITICGSSAIFGMVSEMVNGITNSFFSEQCESETLVALMWCGVFLACLVEILIAKLIWGQTNCSVNNKTLIAGVLGPLAFIMIMLVGTLLVSLVMWAIAIVIAIGALVLGAWCGTATTSGG